MNGFAAPRALFVLAVAAFVTAAPLARAQETPAPRARVAPGAEAGPSLLIESRLTGTHLEAFVDGYTPSGTGVAGPGDLAFPGLAAAPAPVLAAATPWAPLAPPARWVHSMIYDPIRDRLVVFGGRGYSGASNEVWAFYLSGIPHWARLSPSGTAPSPRSFHSAVYDSLQDRMIVFGGNDGADRNDVWALTFGGNPTWSQIAPAGTPPAPRGWHVATIDRGRNRMIVHGGVAGAARYADVWALSLGATPTWSLLSAGGGPGGRSSHAALYDAAGDRLVVFAGIDDAGTVKSDVWALTLGASPTWSQLLPTGTAPTARYGATARYDALRGRALFFGGGVGAPNTNETWALSLGAAPAWTLLAAPNPPQGRQFHTAAYDPYGDRLLVYGGSSGPLLSDTWALPLSSPGAAWIPMTSTRRRGHTAVLDTARRRMVVFAGENGEQLSDVWELGLEPGGTWARLNPSGTPPSPRALHGAIYDERRDRMIVFGGRGGPATNDLWELTFSGTLEWRPIVTQGTPPAARFDHVVLYDRARYRLLVFGGYGTNGTFNDAWQLTLGATPTWSPLSPSGSKPTARAGAQAILDPLRDRLVLFGGYNQSFTPLADAWQLTLGATPAWTALSPAGTPPEARFAAATGYDPTRDRMVLASGTDFNAYFDDTWELKFIGPGTQASWTRIVGPGQGPTSRSDHKAVYDEPADRMVLFGGFNLAGILHDAWEIGFASPVSVPGDPTVAPTRLALRLAGSNPSRSGVRLALDLPAAGRVALTVHDAAGRRVRALDVAPGTAGSRIVTWDGRDEAGRPAPAGVYFARAVADGGAGAAGRAVATARWVLLP